MHIECPHCKTEYNSEDIANTLKNGHYKCPVCEQNFPSSATNKSQNAVQVLPKSKYILPVLIILVITVVSFFLFFKSSDKTETKNLTTLKTTEPGSNPAPASAPVSAPSVTSVSQKTPPPIIQELKAAPEAPKKPDNMQIVEQIAAKYNASHSYTAEGGFVCLDMAIDVWNQLKTNGIDAKIVGGILTESITAWNFRQLAMEGNHAWVIATISPNEQVAIETTAGQVIKKGTREAAPYFKGIVFDNPAEIKRFDLLRKAVVGNCRDANNMVNDWNENVVGKQLRPEEIIARKSQIEQRKQDCERAFNHLKEFESKAIFY